MDKHLDGLPEDLPMREAGSWKVPIKIFRGDELYQFSRYIGPDIGGWVVIPGATMLSILPAIPISYAGLGMASDYQTYNLLNKQD